MINNTVPKVSSSKKTKIQLSALYRVSYPSLYEIHLELRFQCLERSLERLLERRSLLELSLSLERERFLGGVASLCFLARSLERLLDRRSLSLLELSRERERDRCFLGRSLERLRERRSLLGSSLERDRLGDRPPPFNHDLLTSGDLDLRGGDLALLGDLDLRLAGLGDSLPPPPPIHLPEGECSLILPTGSWLALDERLLRPRSLWGDGDFRYNALNLAALAFCALEAGMVFKDPCHSGVL